MLSNLEVYAKVYPDNLFKLRFYGYNKGYNGIAGAAIYKQNIKIWSDCLFLSEKTTNNYAKYTGLRFGLQKAIEMQIKTICVEGDSSRIINQMNGICKCKSKEILELQVITTNLSKQFDYISFNYISKINNDQSVNEYYQDAVIVTPYIPSLQPFPDGGISQVELTPIRPTIEVPCCSTNPSMFSICLISSICCMPPCLYLVLSSI